MDDGGRKEGPTVFLVTGKDLDCERDRLRMIGAQRVPLDCRAEPESERDV